jgi:hypothetical protein
MYMHRYVMDFPDSMVVDHLSWNRLDNRADHLRICTVAENNRNGTNGMMFGKKTRSMFAGGTYRWASGS